MKKFLVPSIVVSAFALASCGSESTESGPETAPVAEPVAETAPSMSEEEVTAPGGPVEVELRETINLTQDANGARDIDVTINEITVSEECRNGMNNYTEVPQEGGYYVTMIGEMDVKQSQTNFSFSDTSLSALDDEQYTVKILPAYDCNYPHDHMEGYQSFANPIDAGQRARGVIEFWVEDMPAEIWFSQLYESDTWFWEMPAQ